MSSDHAQPDSQANDDLDNGPGGGGTVYADVDLRGYGDGPDEGSADGSELPEDVLEQAREVEAELAQARARLADVAPEVVIVNHAMGLYELAAIHLSSQPARLPEAALSIDAFACLVEGLAGRLGPEAATLQDALSQIRLAFVQIKGETTT